MYKNQLHFYTGTINKMKSKLRKHIPFTTAPKRIKYWGINLIQEAKGLYTENYKTLLKEIKHKETLLCSWIGRISSIKMSTLPKATYRLNVIPTEISMAFFFRNRKKYQI